MKAIKKVFSVIGILIGCAFVLMILGTVTLGLSINFGFKTFLIMDGAFVVFLIIKKIVKKARKTETA
ncbi:MAG: hypothetical protein LUI14_14505 [Lachnospiraceae bacterium]|nr:hypothetical protein [Lachnospiraceae bacterium]